MRYNKLLTDYLISLGHYSFAFTKKSATVLNIKQNSEIVQQGFTNITFNEPLFYLGHYLQTTK